MTGNPTSLTAGIEDSGIEAEFWFRVFTFKHHGLCFWDVSATPLQPMIPLLRCGFGSIVIFFHNLLAVFPHKANSAQVLIR